MSYDKAKQHTILRKYLFPKKTLAAFPASRKDLQLLEVKQLQALSRRRAATVRSPTVQQLRPTWPDSSARLCHLLKRICDTGSTMFGLRESEHSRTCGTVNRRK
eukprot:gene12230-3600_t